MIYQLVPCTDDSSGCAVGKGSLKRACVGFILWLSGLIKGAGIQTAFGGGKEVDRKIWTEYLRDCKLGF